MELLTPNVISEIMENNGKGPATFTCQITGWKKVIAKADAKGEAERGRIQISDGTTRLMTCVGVGEIMRLLNDGDLDTFGILEVTNYNMNIKEATATDKVKKILVINNGRVVEQSRDGEIGNARAMDSAGEYMADSAVPSRSTEAQPLSAVQPKSEVRPRAAEVTESVDVKRPRLDDVKPEVKSVPAKRPAQNLSHQGIFPISSLTPYQNKWKIRAMVTRVEPMRHYQNARGEGHIFSVELTDATGSIKATAFKETAQKYHDILKENMVVDISGCQVKSANKRFSSLSNDYELTFSQQSVVEVVQGETIDIPQMTYNFISMKNLPNCKKDDMIDVIGVLKSVGEVMNLTSRAGKELKKRDVVLVDDTKFSVNLTLWGEEAEKFQQSNEGQVMALKGVRVGDFGGVSLSTLGSTRMDLSPTSDRANELSGWWMENNGTDVASLSVRGGGGSANDGTTLIGLIEAWNFGADLAPGEKPEYFTVRGTVLSIKSEQALYKACPEEKCNKRVQEMGDSFMCEKCQRNFDKYKWAAMIQLEMMDMTGNKWLTLFGDQCKVFTGHTAQELGELRERDGEEFTELFNNLLFTTHYFRCSARSETYNDQTSIKWRCYQVRRCEGEEASYVDKLLPDGLAKLRTLQ